MENETIETEDKLVDMEYEKNADEVIRSQFFFKKR